MFMLLAAASSAQVLPCDAIGNTAAKLFTYEDFGSYQRVNSTQCGKSYILFPRGEHAPDLGTGYQYFGVPLMQVAVTQTVTNTFLEAIGVRDKISVASPHTTAPCIAKKVQDGEAEAYIQDSNSAAHVAQMGNVELDAIFSDPWYTGNWAHASSADKVICEASTYEVDPLGSAEWVKFFGYLFGKSTEAETAYCATRSRYTCNSLVADHMKIGSHQVPKVLFTSLGWDGQFSIQMPPYKDKFVKDAGAVYPDLTAFEAFKQMHWTGTQVSGFKFPAVNVTDFHAALQLADVLIDETYPHGQTLGTIADAYQLPKLTVGQTFMTGGDDPGIGSTGWALVSHGVGEKLFTVDSQGDVVPRLAESVVKQSDGSWLLTLAPNRKFSDGSTVTATDVALCLGRTNQMNNAAQSSVGTMTLVAQGDRAVSITTTKATPVMASVLAEWAFVVYKTVDGARIFTGPYVIVTNTSASFTTLELAPNMHYPNAEQRVPINIKKYGTGSAVATALSAGEIDMGFNLPPDAVAPLNWVDGVSVKSFAVGYQYMMFFNTLRTELADVNVRKALALAIDREALAQACAPAGMPSTSVAAAVATGAFPSNTPWGSVHPKLPTNTTEAAMLLDGAGWVLDGSDGLRKKAGVALTLEIVYYTFRSDLVTMAPLIQSQLAAIGITVTLRVNDDGNFREGSEFDMLLWAQHTLPAGDPNWFLETFFYTGPVITGNWMAQNFAQLSSSTIDTALDTLSSAEGTARVDAATAAHQAIINEVPATFLTSPTWHVGLRSRMATYEPWGSDYYVIKPNMPASDWPPAIVAGRVYTLDGTMDANGPPYGGTDWYESRVAEPDGMLSDLIAVLNPTGSNYNPSALHYLRHAGSGTTRSVTASDCTDASASRPILAASCQSLAADATDISLAAVLNGVPNGEAAVNNPTSPDNTEDNMGLYVSIGVLAGALAIAIAVIAWYMVSKGQATKIVAGKPAAASAVSATSAGSAA